MSLFSGYVAVLYSLSYTLATIYVGIATHLWWIVLPNVLFGLALTSISVSGTRQRRHTIHTISDEYQSDAKMGISVYIAGIILFLAGSVPFLIVFLTVRAANF